MRNPRDIDLHVMLFSLSLLQTVYSCEASHKQDFFHEFYQLPLASPVVGWRLLLYLQFIES